MNKLFFLLLSLSLFGCATNPVMTGKPQDWKGHLADDLRNSWGHPTSIIPQSDGSVIWEYSKKGTAVIPKQENTSFNAGGNPVLGVSGGIRTTELSEHVGDYENLYRFQIREGRIKKWFAARYVDGQMVWSDH